MRAGAHRQATRRFAFDVCTEAEAKALDAGESEAAKVKRSATDDLKVVRPRAAPSRPTTCRTNATRRRRRPRRTTTGQARQARARVTYASVADLRAEGVTAAEASDARLELLLAEASSLIDRVTGWFFEPRLLTLRLSARRAEHRAARAADPRRPALRSAAGAVARPERAAHRRAPVQPGFDGLRFTRRHGRTFPARHGNVVAEGLWASPRTTARPRAHAARDPPRDDAPRPARWRRSPTTPRSRHAAAGASSRSGRATRATGSTLEGFGVGASLTGDPEVDALLALYVRPTPLGAA